MKTIVLALDGLEPSFIEKMGLEDFKQEDFGTHDVSMLERIFTPICFAAILTGKDPRSLGYSQAYISQAYQKGYPRWLKPLYWIRRNLFGWVGSIGIRDELAKAGVFDLTKVHRNLNQDMKEHTILNKLKKNGYRVNPIDIPSYNEEFSTSHAQFPNYINKEKNIRQEYLRKLMNGVRTSWLKGIKCLAENDLTFIYSPLPDVGHHLISHITEVHMIEEVYKELSRLPFLFELKHVAVLIMSDHGYEHRFREDGKDVDGDHSQRGFWSMNVKTKKKPESVLDFHDLIQELVTM